MAKGIRVNQLAKELGVASKEILEKCRAEGLAEKVPNHMSVLSLGLSETVREWFSDRGGGTAVETAPPVEAAVKTRSKAVRARKKKVAEEEGEKQENKSKDKSEPVIAEVTAPEPVSEAPAEAKEPAPEAPPETKAPEGPTAPAAPQRPAVVHDLTRPPVQRPTITLANRAGAPAARQPVTPAPRLATPAPAVIQGPKLVREEKPDFVPPPRQRRAPGEAPTVTPPSRPDVGRGVKSLDEEEGEKKKGRTLSNRRRGTDGRRGEAMEKLKEFSEQDLLDRQIRLNAAAQSRSALESHLRKSEHRGQHVQAKSAVQLGEPVEIEEPITPKTLSAALGVKASDIISRLMRQGVFATINQAMDREAAEAIALEYGIELRVAAQESVEEQFLKDLQIRARDPEKLVARPPVVAILGHVDHGKTSLLDKIRNANVAAGEAGGITQHIAAWTVEIQTETGRKRATFIDTPGHQAFTSMRARGAHMTDVVVLVVSAAEGVQPQTIESINHARAAGVPIVVALNKIDRADANPDMVLGQLATQGLNPVEWGGDTEVVRTSATAGQGIKELIEILDYQAELLELKSDPTVSALGTVVESRVDPGLGSVATVLVQDGTLRVGDVALAGQGYGRIRNLLNDRGGNVSEAGPSTPVIVSGLDVLPNAGEKFYVLDDPEQARSIAEERRHQTRQMQLAQQNRVTVDNLLSTMKEADVQTINLIIKGDVQGSVETLVSSVTSQNTEEVKVKVIHAGVGAINESDVELAMATRAKPSDNRVAVIGFNVVPDEAARTLAEQNHIDVKTYRVIYEIFDDLKKALSGMLAPEEREKLHGHVEVRQTFKISRIGTVAGCFVTDGHVQRGSKIRLLRDSRVIAEDLSIETLRRVKDDVREVKSGFECGIKLAGYDDIKIGDVFEAYVRETFERTL